MRKLLLTVLVSFVVGVALPAQQVTRHFTLDDFSKVARVSDPQFAPDGKSIAVVISQPNLDEDRYDPELTVVDIATKASRKVVKGLTGLNFERWSPDGTQFAFLANAGPAGAQKLQVYVVSSNGGAPKAPKSLTSSPRGVQQLAWSPDSKTIAFATQDEPEKKPGFERWNRSFEVTLNSDYTTTEAVPPTHLWMVSAAGGDPKRLTSGTWTMPISHPPGTPASAIVWTPDGSGIVFTRNVGGRGANPPAPAPGGASVQPVPGQRGAGAPSAGSGQAGGGGLQVIHIKDMSITPLGGNGTHPQFSPDGKMVATNNGSVFTIGTNAAAPGAGAQAGRGGNGGPAGSLDRSVARALWLPDGKSLIIGGNDSERVSLWQTSIAGGDPRKLDTQGVSPNSSFFVDMSISKDGAIAFTGTTPVRPAELYYMASPTSPVQQLTMVNDELATIPLGKSEVVGWKNDNFEENGIVTYPPDFKPSQKYPLVLYIHGGPAAASMMTWSSQAQLLAAQGWVVFQPNYRGSDNLGRQYQSAIRNDAGEGPGKDVIAGIESLKQKGFVDDTRMCVSGWSYGGYMTTWMTGHYPDLWKCAVTGASVTNRLDQYNFSDSAGGGGGNSPWTTAQNMDRTMAQSPISAASKVKAPTLILHDTGDYRVAITESFEWFHALRDNGVTTQFIAYPVYGHSPSDPVHQRDVQRRWIEWMQTYLGPNTSTNNGGGATSVQYRSPEGVEYRSLPDTDAIRSARAALTADPKSITRIIELGVAESGARQFREAIATFTRGLAIEPNNALLLRWRGHRYLSVREFDRAFADLTRGSTLDGTIYGLWYHLGVVQYVRGDFSAAAAAFAKAQPIAPDAGELAGSTDWLWMSLSRAERGAEAKAMLDRRPDNKPVDNAYTRRLQLYRGEIGPDAVLTAADTDDVQVATLAYGLGNWYLIRGDKAQARTWFERSIQSGGWPAFGFIASEAELRRLR